MKCMKRQLFKRVVLVAALIVGISLQSTMVQAAENNSSAETWTYQTTVYGTPGSSDALIVHNRNYVWKAYYGSYTIQFKLNLETGVLKEAQEYNPCNIDICKLLYSCEERAKFESYLCENLVYADGTLETTVTNGCGWVIYRCKKPIHKGTMR